MKNEFGNAESRLRAGVDDLRELAPPADLATDIIRGPHPKKVPRIVLAGACTAVLLTILWWPSKQRAVSAAEALDELKNAPAIVIQEYNIAPGSKKKAGSAIFVGDSCALLSDQGDYYIGPDGFTVINWVEKYVAREATKFPPMKPVLDTSKLLRSGIKKKEEMVAWEGREVLRLTARKTYGYKGQTMAFEEILYVDPATKRPVYYENWRENRAYGKARSYEYPTDTENLLKPRDHAGFRELDMPALRDQIKKTPVESLPVATVKGREYRLLGLFVDVMGYAFAAVDGGEPGLSLESLKVPQWGRIQDLALSNGHHENGSAKRAQVEVGGQTFYLAGGRVTSRKPGGLVSEEPVTIRVPIWSKDGRQPQMLGYAEYTNVIPTQIWSAFSFFSPKQPTGWSTGSSGRVIELKKD